MFVCSKHLLFIVRRRHEILFKTRDVWDKQLTNNKADKAMSYEEIIDTICKNASDMSKPWHELHSQNQTGGKMRASRGKEVEFFVSQMIKYISERFGKDIRVVSGTHDKKPLKSEYHSMAHQVDLHVYAGDRFIAVIECKTYLDLSFYKRALMDFLTFRKGGYKVKCYVFSLEDSLKDSSKGFYDDVFDHPCTDVFYAYPGKRASNKPLYDPHYAKRIDKLSISRLVDTILRDHEEALRTM